MDLTVNNNFNNNAFGAKLDFRTKRAIRRGINSKIKSIRLVTNRKVARNVKKLYYDKLYQQILDTVAQMREGTFSFYNKLGQSLIPTHIAFWDGSYTKKALPVVIKDELKVVDAANFWVAPNYKMQEFPANRLLELQDFLENFFKTSNVETMIKK